jgi:hypothetical protein
MPPMRKLLAVFFIGACSGSSIHVPGDLGSQTTRLISADYKLDAGQEQYLCQRTTLTKDFYITAMTPSSGPGTHHEVLGIDTSHSHSDGVTPCGGQEIADIFNWTLLFASGLNSPALTMPDGVALHVHAGDQLVMQMHLLNATQSAVSSTAYIDVATVDGSTLPTEAQMILAGPIPDSRITSDIPVGDNQIVDGGCTLTADTHYFAVFPHMHQIGKHIQVRAVVGGNANTLYDADYSFDNQTFAEFSPLSMKKGDRIEVTCTYDNETGMPVSFGTSSYEEMCFAISYLYPPLPTGQLGDFCSY